MKRSLPLLVVASVMLLLNLNRLQAQVAGQIPLNPASVPKFVDPMPHFAGLRVDAKAGGDLYVKVVPHTQVAVSTGTILNNGTVGVTPGAGVGPYWVYQVSTDGINFTPPNWPSFTIEAQRGNPLNVTYLNELTGQTYSDVNLIVDQTLHWAMSHMGMGDPMMPYDGEVPIVTHLHGGEVASESDGGPDAWFTPGLAMLGPSWDQGVDQYYYYPNTQEAATLWYHDHALGATRLNVYAGMAGYYFLRGPEEETLQLPGWSGDDLVKEVAPVGKSGVFNPNPYLPELELAIQDRMFDQNGELYYPNLPTNPMIHPYWTPEFVGNIITVNGKTWPYISVAPRKYRIRMLDGSNARFYELWLQDLATGAMGPTIYQVGTDGGLLDTPVAINPNLGGKLIMGPGERADIIIDFSGSAPGQVWTLRNSGRTPYPNGAPPQAATLGRIMQFVVNGQMVSASNPTQQGIDKSQLPAALRPAPGLVKLTNFAGATTVTPDKVRKLTLVELMGMGGPLEMLVNNTKWDANGMEEGLGESEIPVEGKTEVWQIINLTADAHPMHLHLVQFQLVSRQKFRVNQYNAAYNAAFPGGVFIGGYGPPKPYDFYYNATNTGYLGGNPDVAPYLQGPVKPANANERGWKDTFIMYPGEVTTVVVRFAPTDLPTSTPAAELLFGFDPSEGPGYVWHCHIIDHEDNEMMRPYKVEASPFRTPAPLVPGGTIGRNQSKTAGSNALVGFALDQNSPNPFNNETEIRFRIPVDCNVQLRLFNSMGAEVQTLINESAKAGYHSVMLHADNLDKGIYFYQLNAGTYSEIKKLVVVR